jgi:hypothetical protein
MKERYYLQIKLLSVLQLAELDPHESKAFLDSFNLFKVFSDKSVIRYSGVRRIGQYESLARVIPKDAFKISEEQFLMCLEWDFEKITREMIASEWPEFFI